MSYNFCEENILDTPQKYMYTRFDGIKFLRSYREQRMKTMNGLFNYSQTGQESNIEMQDDLISGIITYINTKNNESLNQDLIRYIINQNQLTSANIKHVKKIKINKKIKTDDLLRNIILLLIHYKNANSAHLELDQLIQRFEVTKKIYNEYQIGMKNGTGKNDNLENYWLFGIALCYTNIKKINLKHFNTLIKICDLLTSIEIKILLNQISKKGLISLFIFEMHIYESLMNQKGIKFDT